MGTPIIERTYFHIGTGKAGSSSIQAFLRENYESLKKLGYVVPRAAGVNRHFNLFHITAPPASIKNFYGRFRLPRRVKFATVEDFTSAVLDEMREASAKCAVFSEETLALTAGESDIRKLATWARQLSQQSTIICYVRRQDLALMSHFQQRIKAGWDRSLEHYCESGIKTRFDYYSHLRPWADVFGVENVRVVPFEPSAFHHNSLIQDFAKQLDLAEEAALDLSERRVNSSLGAAHLEILMRINERVPRSKRYVPLGQTYRALRQALKQAAEEPKASLPIELARDFLAHFEESNRRVATEFLGKKDGLLFKEPLRERHPVLGEALTLEVAHSVIAALAQMNSDQDSDKGAAEDLQTKTQAALDRAQTLDDACNVIISLLQLDPDDPNTKAEARRMRVKARTRRARHQKERILAKVQAKSGTIGRAKAKRRAAAQWRRAQQLRRAIREKALAPNSSDTVDGTS